MRVTMIDKMTGDDFELELTAMDEEHAIEQLGELATPAGCNLTADEDDNLSMETSSGHKLSVHFA